jgi:hypothetical protein
MVDHEVVADYVIKGAGAAGMAFADAMFTHGDATMVLVDRHDRPGGHWNDVYPFVRLHQPSASYGVNSTDLGTGRIDSGGLNAGYHELASGNEILSHYDLVLRHRLLPSGRVRFFPMSEVSDDGVITSLLSGAQQRVAARRFVDATHSRMQVPSMAPPSYPIGADVACVPLNELPRVAAQFDEFVVIGAGKTGMDACIWLLGNGADPDHIRWIVSRDSWVLDRGNVQPGDEFFAALCKSIADQAECASLATSLDDLFVRLEAAGELRRIDPDVKAEAYHCAILSDDELAQLRRIRNVVRLGRVTAIDRAEIFLDRGTIPTSPTCLHIDCSAAGIPGHPSKPVFSGERITLQWVRTCQPTFSAAMIGFVEATFADDDVKNHICNPIAPPTVPLDWLTMMHTELANRANWAEFPEIDTWLSTARLDPFTKYARRLLGVDAEATAHLQRYITNVGPAAANIVELLAHARG